MDYKQKYEEALERAKESLKDGTITNTAKGYIENIFPELVDTEDERLRKTTIAFLKDFAEQGYENAVECIDWLEKQCEPQDKGEISDGYHTFNELYYYRMLYNAAFFNLLPKEWVHKSKKHHDGEECFGGGWFIVMANLPTGQISNHYELKYWELFHIPEKDVADEWDGHTPKEAAERLHKCLLGKQGEKISAVDFKAEDWYVSKVDGKIYNAKFIEKNPTNQDRKLEIEKAALSTTGIIEQEEWFIKGAEWADKNPSCIQIENQTDKVEPKFHEGDWITIKE